MPEPLGLFYSIGLTWFFLYLVLVMSTIQSNPDTCEVKKQVVDVETPEFDPWKGDKVTITIWIVAQEWTDYPAKKVVVRPSRRFVPWAKLDNYTAVPVSTEADAAINFLKVGSTHPCFLSGWTMFYYPVAFRHTQSPLWYDSLYIVACLFWCTAISTLLFFTYVGCVNVCNERPKQQNTCDIK